LQEEEDKGITFIEGENKETFLSYKNLYKKALEVLGFLQFRGIKASDELVFQIEDNEKFMCTFWACIMGGIIPVPVSIGNNYEHRLKLVKIWNVLNNPYMITDEKNYINFKKFKISKEYEKAKENLDSRTILLEEFENWNQEGVLAETELKNIAFVQFSSGSTGDPKGVIVTHEMAIYNSADIVNEIDLKADDRVINWMPLTHDMGLIAYHLTCVAGKANQYIMPTSLFIRRPTLWLKKTSEHKATHLYSPNFGYKHLLTFYKYENAKDWDLSSVRVILNGAEPISKELCEEFLDKMSIHGLDRRAMIPCYGLAEATVGVALSVVGEKYISHHLDRRKLNVSDKIAEINPDDNNCLTFLDEGYCFKNCSIRICDDNGKVLEDDTVGYIQIKGRNVTAGYYNNSEATEKVLVGEGWLNTGDLGFIRKGRITITGRAKDIIFINGQNYYPHDIERIGEEVEGVEIGKIAAVGVKNMEQGSEDVVLFVIFKGKIERFVPLALNLKKTINSKMGLEVKEIVPIRKMLKTTSGKIQRFKLGEMYVNGEYNDNLVVLRKLLSDLKTKKRDKLPKNEIEKRLIDICVETLEDENISINDSFMDIGANSMKLNQIAERIESIFPGKISVTDFFTYPTVSKLAEYIYQGENSSNVVSREKKAYRDIAVIGMSARFPMADSIDEFWENLRAGLDCVTEFPVSRRQDTDKYFKTIGQEVKYLKGAYIKEIDKFDYKFFKMSPKEASLMNPAQRMVLEASYESIEDAGYSMDSLRNKRVGVFLGYIGDLEGHKYKDILFKSGEYPHPSGTVGNIASILPSRISYFMDFKGPSMLVDTACSSSLVSVHLACKSVRDGESEMALAGGVKLYYLPVESGEKLGIESSDGITRSFDEDGDGTGFGEGLGMVMLKPLDKAVEDGDNIYAVIKGSAINQDGASIGITAPNAAQQAEVINSAWENSGIHPETISYIEAHGSATKLGDPVEIDGIKKAFSKYTNKIHFCSVGSVKSNIGHLLDAAGIAGFIKSVLSIKNRELPPSIHFNNPNSRIDFSDSPVYVNSKLKEWKSETGKLRCGINSMGLSGTNCHVILEEPPIKGQASENLKACTKSLKIITMSHSTVEGLKKTIEEYKCMLDNPLDKCLEDVCYTANTGRGHYGFRLAVLFRDEAELRYKLDMFDYKSNEEEGIYYGVHKVVSIKKQLLYEGELTEDNVIRLTQESETLFEMSNKGEYNSEVLLKKICGLYIKGAKINFNNIYINEKRKRVSVPKYPFEDLRCWVEYQDTMKDNNKLHSVVGCTPTVGNSDFSDNKGGNIKLPQYSSEKTQHLEPKEIIVDELKSIVANITHMKKEDVDEYSSLLEMGLDSIMLTEARQGIKDRFFVSIELILFFDKLDNLDAISSYIAENLPDNVELCSEAKAQNDNLGVESIKDTVQPELKKTSDNLLGSAQGESLEALLSQQLNTVQSIIMNQIELLRDNTTSKATDGGNTFAKLKSSDSLKSDKVNMKDVYVPYRNLDLTWKSSYSDKQRMALDKLIESYNEKTRLTKETIQKYRYVYANNRNVAGFRPEFKEMVYQLIVKRAKGSRIWDVDGNEYIDLTMGFGVNLFGHSPDFIEEALKKEISEGMPVGPMSDTAGLVAESIAELTGVERVAFFNTGTEAVMVALRLARAATGRDKIVLFAGSYHGTYDGVLALSNPSGDRPGDAIPIAPGLLQCMADNIVVLNYGTKQSLEVIKELGSEIAAVLCESVQSRRPDHQPKEFLHELREITEENGTALIFDEVITGFRISAGGAQEFYGIKADIVTYGKVIGGGMPIGIVAGKARYMDGIDGGMWNFGDRSIPPNESGRTFVAGTFCHHPLAMEASLAVLKNIKEQGRELYNELNMKTQRLTDTLNSYFEEENVPIRMVRFGSLFRFVLKGDFELLFYYLIEKGIYIWEGRNCFISTAHTDNDIDFIINAVKESIKEMREGGFMPDPGGGSPSGKKGKDTSSQNQIGACTKRDYYPLSSAQNRLFTLNQMEKDSTMYNEAGMLVVEGAFDLDRLENAFRQLIQRHEALRTSFHIIDGQNVQKIHENVDFKVEYTEADESKLLKITKDFVRPFQLDKAPLIRVGLVKVSENKHIMMVDTHHIVADGYTYVVLLQEFSKIYKGEKLDNIDIQYKDFAVWNKELLQSQSFKRQEEFWLSEYGYGQEEIPVLNLPIDFNRPSIMDFNGDRIVYSRGKEFVEKLRKFSAKEKATLYIVLLSAYNVLLSKYCGQEDIIVGGITTGRDLKELKNIAGMFVNTLPLRNKPNKDKTFKEFIKEVRMNFFKAYENQQYPFEYLVEKLGINRDISRNPLFDTMFVVEGFDNYSEISVEGLSFEPYSFKHNSAKFDIMLTCEEKSDTIDFIFEYRTSLFRKQSIENMAEHFANLINNLIDNSEDRISEVEILTEQEKREILHLPEYALAAYPEDETIQSLFEEQVRINPNRTALVMNGKEMTYKELNEKANVLAWLLREKGVTKESVVAAFLERSFEMIIAVLAILKAGGVYLPVDPKYPDDRIEYMLKDSGAKILLTAKNLINRVSFEGQKINLDDSEVFEGVKDNPYNINTPENSAYVIYTSGTTGKPKGAVIEHRNVVRLLFNDKIQFDFDQNDVWTMFHSFCFDFSVWEMYGALLYGGKLVIVPEVVSRDTKEFASLIRKERVTVLNQTPTAFYNLIKEEIKDTENRLCIRYVIFGGEALKPVMLKPWRNKYKDTKLINMYGITETTVHVTYKEITEQEIEMNVSNIGKPIPTLVTYVVDRNMKLLPPGIPGELLVGGAGVGRGYLNRPELTNEKFIENPFDSNPYFKRVYRSGDLVRLLPNGEMEYMGRIDHQVKIRGFRIELGEIENCLIKHPSINEVVVAVREDKDSNKYLCGYFVSDEEIPVTDLREFLLMELPDYMVPAYFVKLDMIPMTSNQKVNTKALPEPEMSINTGIEYVPPEGDSEQKAVLVWEEILGIKKVGVNDNFYTLGGDSIKALQISARLKSFGYSLEVKELLKNPTIRESSLYVKPVEREISQDFVEGEVVLLPMQRWYFENRSYLSDHYNKSVLLYAPSGFDKNSVEKAAYEIVCHHDAMRIVYNISDKEVRQINKGLEPEMFEIKEFDLRNVCDTDKVIEHEVKMINASMDIIKGPLVKLALFKTENGDYLLLSIHQLISDEVSFKIILEDFDYAYNISLKGEEIVLPPKTDSFIGWSKRLSEYAQSKANLKELEFWKQIENREMPVLKKDFESSENIIADEVEIHSELSKEQTENLLEKVNSAYNTDINIILLAALGIAVKEWADISETIIDVEGSGREQIIEDFDITRTLGCFTSIYPVVIDAASSDNMPDYIKYMKESIRKIPNNGIGYGILKYLTSVDNKKDIEFRHKPEILFNFLGQTDIETDSGIFEIKEGIKLSPVADRTRTLYTFVVKSNIVKGRFKVTINYSSKQYREETVRKLLDSYIKGLKDIIDHCINKDSVEVTPSDLGYNEMSIDELDNLNDFINNM